MKFFHTNFYAYEHFSNKHLHDEHLTLRFFSITIFFSITNFLHDELYILRTLSWRTLGKRTLSYELLSYEVFLYELLSGIPLTYLLPPFLPPTNSYLLPPFLLPTSLSTSYLPFYLLPPFLPPTSLFTSYLSFASLSISYLAFYLLPPFLPPTSHFTSYLSFDLLPPFLSPTALSTSYLPFYLLPTSYLSFYLLIPFLSPTSYLPLYYLPPFLLPTSLTASYLFSTSYLLSYLKFIATLQFLNKTTKIIHTERINYSRDAIVQSVPQIDSSAHNIPQEEASAVNEESTREPSSTVDLPIPQEYLFTLLKAVVKADNQQTNVEWPTRDQLPISQFTTDAILHLYLSSTAIFMLTALLNLLTACLHPSRGLAAQDCLLPLNPILSIFLMRELISTFALSFLILVNSGTLFLCLFFHLPMN